MIEVRGSGFWMVAVALVACAMGACKSAEPRPSASTVEARQGGEPLAPSTPPSSSAASGAPSSAPPPVASAPAGSGAPTRWTDPRIVSELAKDCRHVPVGAAPKDDDTTTALSCAAELFSQSCVVDPCHDKDQTECQPRCLRGCVTCGDACVGQCEACKAKCTDFACRSACAATCGACREECLAGKDRCSSGECISAYKDCRARIESEWRTGKCPAACVTFTACREACKEGDQRCSSRCEAALARVCPRPLRDVCIAHGFGPGEER